LVVVQEAGGHLQLYSIGHWIPVHFKKPAATFNYRLMITVQETGGHLRLQAFD
jgi:hypothetical protein